MYFDSLSTNKQYIRTVISQTFKSAVIKKQVRIDKIDSNIQTCPLLKNNKIQINKSKSEKQLLTNKFMSAHLQHPILIKNKKNKGHLQNFNTCSLASQQALNVCRVMESVNTTQRNQYNNKILYQSNDFYNNIKHQRARSRDDFFGPLNQSQVGENFDIPPKILNSQYYNQSSQEKLSNNFNFTPPMSLLKNEQPIYDNRLQQTVKNLQKQIRGIKKQRDNDKAKLLQYSLNLDKLKFENQCLKINKNKSKQILQSNHKDILQLNQLKKQLKEEIQNKQETQKQRLSILLELNETLIMQQNEKNKWQKQKKNMQNKIDTLVLEIKQKKDQYVQIYQKINIISCQNKKLKATIRQKQEQIQNQCKEGKWLRQRVNDLKQALQLIKISGNYRIKQLQQQIFQLENKKYQNISTQHTILKNKLQQYQKQNLQFKQQIQQHYIIINNSTKQLANLQKMILELRKQKAGLQNQIQIQNKIHDNKIQDKDKLILQITNNLQSMTVQKDNKENQKLKLSQKILSMKQQLKNTNLDMERKNKQITYFHEELKRKSQQIQKIAQQKCKQQKQRKKVEIMSKQLEQKDVLLESHIQNMIGLINQKQKCMKIYQSKVQVLQKQLLQTRKHSEQNLKILQQNNITNQQLCQQIQDNCNKKQQQIQNFKQKYNQLQLRLCSALGICLTSNIDKIITPIQQMMKNKRNIQNNQKFNQQPNKIVEITPDPNKLISQICQLKQKYNNLLYANKQISNQMQLYRQQNSFLINKNQQINQFIKRMESLMQDTNQIIVNLQAKLLNIKYKMFSATIC